MSKKEKGAKKKPLSVSRAEEKLFENPNLEYENLAFKSPFSMPGEVWAHDVYLEVSCDRLPKKLSKSANQMTEKCKHEIQETIFGWKFTATKSKARLQLKIYLEECSDGNREARIYAPDSGAGLVKLKFSWLLSTIDRSAVLDGGRFAEIDSRWNGVLDSLHWRSGESALLYQMLPKLCGQIDKQIYIPVKKTGWFS